MISLLGDVLAEERERIRTSPTLRSQEREMGPLSQATWLVDLLGGVLTDAGVRVNEHTAFQIVTFLSCVLLISSKIASLPFNVYERSYWEGRPVRKLAYDHPSSNLVSGEPNDEMTAQTMWKVFLMHVLAWSSGFCEIQWAASGHPINLWPRNPDATFIRRLTADLRLDPEPWRPWEEYLPAGTLVCETTDGAGATDRAPDYSLRIIPMDSVIYVPGITFDGRLPQRVVHLCRRTLGLAMAMEKFGAKYFGNFAKPGGILELPQQKPEDRIKSKETWLETMSGENVNKTFVGPPGTKWTGVSHNPEEAQAIEAQQHVRTLICSIFQVAPRFAGDTSKNSRATSEQDALELLEYTLRPWMNALCQEVKRKLFPSRVTADGRRIPSPYFVAFDEWQIVRPDSASRERFYASGRQWSYMNANDVREREGMNPIEKPWAEEYIMPVNMTLTTTPVDPRRDRLPDSAFDPSPTRPNDESSVQKEQDEE